MGYTIRSVHRRYKAHRILTPMAVGLAFWSTIFLFSTLIFGYSPLYSLIALPVAFVVSFGLRNRMEETDMRELVLLSLLNFSIPIIIIIVGR